MRIVWRSTGSGGPGGEEAHLFGPYSATITHTGDARHGEWRWSVRNAGNGDDAIVLGFATSCHDAEQAVVEWAAPRAPRSWRRRLRFVHRSP